MKKLNLIKRLWTDSHEKQSPQRFARYAAMLIMLLTLGVGQMWAGDLTPKGKYFYFKASDTWAPDARFAVCFQWKDGGGQDDSWYSCIAVGGETDIYYAVAPDKYWDMYFCRMQASNPTNSWSNPPCWNTSDKMQYDGTNKYNYFVKSSGWNGSFTYNSIYVPKVKAVTLSWDVVPSSGSGTELDPYIVPTGTNVTVKATGEAQVADPDATLKYKWDSGSYDTDDDIVLSCSTNNTKYSTTVTCKNYISSSSSATTQSATVWFKAVTAPTISLAVKRSSTTVSNVYSGETLTLVASASNAGATPNIVYEYSTSSSFPGGSTTQIASTTSTSQSWTVPANTAQATLYVRARVTSIGYECTSSTSTLTAYGRKIIYVRDNNNWGPSNIKIHHWGTNDNATEWPGTKTGVTAIGGQWISVVVYSCYDGFVLDDGTGTNNQDKTVDLLYTGSGCVSHNTYYTMSTNANSKQTLSSSTAPAKPTVTTSSAGTIRETSAVLGGNVTAAGNDDYTERGYYWSTNSGLSSSNLGVGTKVVVSSEVSSSTGAFSNTKSGLTAGTTYYVIAYATNGQGTNYGSVQNFTTLSTYSITVAAGSGGSASPSSVTAGQYQSSGTITATPGSNFAFVNWTASSNKITIASATSKSTTVTATATGTVTANFADKWNVKSDQWDSWGTYKGLPNVSSNTFRQSFDLPAKTTYHFKVVKRADAGGDDVWYGVDGGKTLTRGSNSVTGLEANGGGTEYITFTTDAAGSYTITYVYNASAGSMQVTVGYPTAYTVTFGMGDHAGSSTAITATASPSFSSGDYVLPETDITFGKGSTKTGYTWKGWYSNSDGTGTKHSSTDANLSWTATRTGNISVYACYDLVDYDITYINMEGATNHGSNPDSYTIEDLAVTLYSPSKTGYTFSAWKAKNSSGSTVTSIAKGSTLRDTTLYAAWTAKDYTITLKPNGGSGDDQSVTATFDATAPDYDADAKNYKFADITNPTKTGYNFEGWWTSSDAGTTLVTEIITKYKFYEWNTSYVNNSGLWKNAGDVTAYAKWTPATYTVTLDYEETGKGTDGEKSSVTATYNAGMPAMGSAPVGATGYKFMGYFTEAGGGGTKYYNADGSSAKNWDIANNTTLYAHFLKSEITGLEHDASIAKGEEVTIDVNPVINVTPEGYTAICWSLLYADTDNPVEGAKWSVAAKAEVGKPMQVRYTLTGLENGSYKIKAEYKSNASSGFDACSTGTTQNTFYSTFRIIGSNTVTIRFRDHDLDATAPLRANGSVEVPAMDSAEVTAPDILGYTFRNWSLGGLSSGVSYGYYDYGSGKRLSTNTDKTIVIKATYDGTITAYYDKKPMIYFNNTLEWDTVYAYFYSSNKYWDDDNGTGAQWDKTLNSAQAHYYHMWGGMTKIPGTNIYYLDYEDSIANASWNSEIRGYTNVAFTDKPQGYGYGEEKKGYEFFYDDAQVVRRGDFDHRMPMFVPLSEPTEEMNGKKAIYYTQGFWMDYADSTGYILNIYDNRTASYPIKKIPFVYDTDTKLPLSVTVDLEAGKTYGIEIKRADGNVYRNANAMSNGHSGDEGQPVWEFTTGHANKAGLTTSGAGYYTFTLSYGEDLNEEFNYLVGVRYPEATGDFRVQYKDGVNSTWKTSAVIPMMSDVDTVSYFARTSSPYIRVQKCTATYEEGTTTVTWSNVDDGEDILPDTIKANGVYNFVFTKNGDRSKLSLSAVEPYTGNFYIRVDGAGYSNWANYRATDHLMPYSDYSFNQTTDPYSHYFMKYYDTSAGAKNIKFVVANDYSTNISDTIVRDGIADSYVDKDGWLSGRNANIRFMYNYKTNVATRRYLDDAQGDNSANFLNLLAQTKDNIYLVAEDGSAQTEIKFDDKGDWIYEKTVYAVPGARYKLRGQFGVSPGTVIPQWFKGGAGETAADSATLVGGSGSRMQIRIVYDFKTNRLIAAYIPSGTISTDQAIHADVMFVREGHEDVTQLTFTNSAKLTDINNVYSVLRFNKYTLNNLQDYGEHAPVALPKSIYERSLYFVSFPFDVKLSDVIGFGTYWNEWYVEYYDGAARAKNGFWIDSESYWKYVTPAMKDTFVLKAGTGYLFGLDLDYLGTDASIWENTSTADFIFPGNVNKITSSSVTYTLPAHTCTINRGTASGNRTIADSHWNVLGVPTYLNTESMTLGGEGASNENFVDDGKLKYIYSWNPMDNSLSPTSASGFKYHAMHAYVVQYYGTVTFTTSVSPATAPRRNPEYRGEYEFRLEIQKNEEAVDQTFVRLSDEEDVTANFEFGHDLTKAQNGHAANIYTIVEGYLEAAGNSLPLTNQTTIVPVGVKVNNAGDFTFSMPDGTEGIGVTLIDNETGISTQLSALDYTINLAAGTYNNRFLLVISPIVQNPTGIEDVTGDESQVTGARKVIIDQKMYIIKDGKMFDAQGRQVK